MKLIIAIVLLVSVAQAEETYVINGKGGHERGAAIIALAKDASTKVQRVTDMKLSEKGTLTKR